MGAFIRRLLALVRRNRLERDLDDELSFHLSLREAEQVRQGLGPRDAERVSRRQFGNLLQTKEHARDAWLFASLESLLQDVRFALRRCYRAPGFALVAILTLGLGIGAITAIFSVVDAILIRPLPYPDADRLVYIVNHRTEADRPVRSRNLSLPYFTGVREHARSMSAIGGYDSFSNLTRQRLAMIVEGRDGAAELLGTRMSPVLFSMLGARPLLGRLFTDTEERAGNNAVILLSHRVWRTQFGGEAEVLQRSLTLDGRSYSVIGILPPDFQFPDRQTDFWIPLTPAPLPPPSAPRSDSPETYYTDGAFGLLREGVPREAATAEIESILRQIDRDQSARYGWPLEKLGIRASLPRRAEIVPVKTEQVESIAAALRVFPVAAALVLLIACGNVTNLLLARAASRQRELAMRAALGGSRGRLMREALIEAGVLTAIGGIVALPVAFWGMRAFVALAPPDIPRIGEVTFQLRTLAYAAAVSFATTLAVGLVPALRVAAAERGGPFTRDQRAASSFSMSGRIGAHHPAIVAEIAIATVLLISAGLLIRSFIILVNVRPGYDARNVLTFQLALPQGRVADSQGLYENMMARIASMPAVEAVGATDVLPILGTSGFHFALEGLPVPPGPGDSMTMRVVSGDYFRAMGIRVIEGQTFAEGNSTGRPESILVNREFVRRYFAGESPVGRIVGRSPATYAIAGVVDDIRHEGLHAEPRPEYYVDFRTFTLTPAVRPYFVVRTKGAPTDIAPTVRALARQLEPEAAVTFNLPTMAEIVSHSVVRPRFHTLLLTTFAIAAVILAAIGIYGVMTYSIAQRTREIGIRTALGARRIEVMSLVFRQTALLTAAGVGIGFAGAAAVTRYLEGMLFGLTPLDPATFATVALMLAGVSALAAYLPARRAARVDPLVALRCE
jgi:predicted permease